MKTPTAFAAALASAMLAIGLFAQSPQAQTTDERPAACADGRQEISASALRERVDAEACRADGRPIVDGAVGAELPSLGRGVHVEALTTDGAQELEVRHLPDGTIELDHVGEEPEAGETIPGKPDEDIVSSRARGECGDSAFSMDPWRVQGTLAYRINWRTTPRYLSRRAAISAIRQAGGNVAGTVNGCKMGDRMPAGIAYKGYTARYSDRQHGSCTSSDGISVVSFGHLKAALAVTCTYFDWEPGYDVVTSSDVKIDNTGRRWTTNPRSRSCRGRYDLEGVMTHERGHTFGLGHVSEAAHRNLTMSPTINGPCQISERSLGRGDVLGLDRKYP